MMNAAIETAVRMETDAMKFYHEASQKTNHPFAKRMFEGFIRDEKRHLEMLTEILKGLDLKIVSISPQSGIKTVFSELKEQMMSRISATTDEMEAVKVALDFETEGYEFYKKAARETTDEKERQLFTVLEHEEEEHFRILQNTHQFLKNTGDWFMWEEHGILEG